MKKVMLLMVFVGSVLFLGGCGLSNRGIGMVRPTGDVTVETFEVDDFTSFRVGGTFDVTFRYADHHEVTIEMAENLFDYIEVTVSRGALSIGTRSGVGIEFGDHQPQVTIYAPVLESARLSGSATAMDWDAIIASNFSIELSGASDATLDVTTEALNVQGSGSSNIELSGVAPMIQINLSGASDLFAELITEELELTASGSSTIELTGSASVAYLDISGASDILASNLQTEVVDIEASGSTHVEMAVSEQLNVVARGSSRVQYLGHPAVTQEVSGSATIGPME